MITRVDLIHPMKHPAMGAAEMPTTQFSATPIAPGEPAYLLTEVGDVIVIMRGGKYLRVHAGNLKGVSGIVESDERSAPAKVKRA